MSKRILLVGGGTPVNLSTLNLPPIDVTVGIDQGIETLVKDRRTPITLAIGDFDSVSDELKEQLPTIALEVLSLPEEKDVTDTEAALLASMDRFEADEYYLTGVFGGRVDHFISNLFLIHQPRFDSILEKIRLVDERNTIRFFRPGTYTLTKEADKTYLSFIGMTPIEGLNLVSVKYALQDASYDYPMALISNEFIGTTAQFSFSKGIVAVIQSK